MLASPYVIWDQEFGSEPTNDGRMPTTRNSRVYAPSGIKPKMELHVIQVNRSLTLH